MVTRTCAEKGHVMKNTVVAYHFETVEERHLDRSVYTLLRLVRGDLLKYAVVIEDPSGIDLALLNGEKKACCDFFDKIVAGELSSVHLCEAAQDFSLAQTLEIF